MTNYCDLQDHSKAPMRVNGFPLVLPSIAEAFTNILLVVLEIDKPINSALLKTSCRSNGRDTQLNEGRGFTLEKAGPLLSPTQTAVVAALATFRP